MPLSYAELKSMLDVDEPDYPALATMAAGAMTHLRKLAASPDISIASKAVSLAGMIGSSASVGVVGEAAKSDDAIVRAAAAHAASYLPDTPKAASVVSTLLADKDIGVVKLAARAAAGQGDRALTAQARRAVARVESTDRATQTTRGKAKNVATRAPKKAAAKKAAPRKSAAKKAAAKKSAAMPKGNMSDAPRGAKARTMPTGKMK
jgi:hypothetical protein